MSKSTATYWNVLAESNKSKWEPIEGSSGMLEQLTLAIDEISGDYTCSGQQILATVLEVNQYNRSDSFGVNPPLY
ncbi:hypothetical protein C9J41_21280 [Photobacterium sp. GB-50]|uniref:hypothetical protein n=1 Tax=Photobacterium sp. GB-50 TaxID=2022107 RepID=UPI000D160E2B|nr:hypothetical protein [Photobacterium sp. GB-50]PSW69207.1 hypothetical protein C9J41_21280 [Photobacterium sp. GB-50]